MIFIFNKTTVEIIDVKILIVTNHLIDIRTTDDKRISKYRPEVYKSEKSKILQKIHKVALGKLLT